MACFDNAFKGALDDENTRYLNNSFSFWMECRELTLDDFPGRHDDLQAAALFPVVYDVETMGQMVAWMTTNPTSWEIRQKWLEAERLSADEISARADLRPGNCWP